MSSNKLIVCLTGMPGAGKSTIAEALKHKGYKKVTLGDAVRREAKRRNLEPTSQNLGKLMLELREKGGPGVVAQLVKEDIENAESDVVIVDGIRSYEEVIELRRYGTVKVLSIHASSDTRFGFLSSRNRSDDPLDQGEFLKRDTRELGVGISKAIALADETISNNEITIEELIEKTHSIIDKWKNEISK